MKNLVEVGRRKASPDGHVTIVPANRTAVRPWRKICGCVVRKTGAIVISPPQVPGPTNKRSEINRIENVVSSPKWKEINRPRTAKRKCVAGTKAPTQEKSKCRGRSCVTFDCYQNFWLTCYLWMSASFCVGQTFVRVVGFTETVESLGGVEIELIRLNQWLQFQKAFHSLNFRPGIFDELVAIDDVHLASWEDVQPTAQEFGIQGNVQCSVLSVNFAGCQQCHILMNKNQNKSEWNNLGPTFSVCRNTLHLKPLPTSLKSNGGKQRCHCRNTRCGVCVLVDLDYFSSNSNYANKWVESRNIVAFDTFTQVCDSK